MEDNMDQDKIIEEVLKYAHTLEVICPSEFTRRHCWYCAYCEVSKKCPAWRMLTLEVEFYKRSGPPLSLYALEEMENAENSHNLENSL
jgi:hypothetical protein